MSDHKLNPTAMLENILPDLLPYGMRARVDFTIAVAPALGVLPLPPDLIRVADDGSTEFRDPTKDEWIKVPEGGKVHPIDKPLPPELCDVVVMIGTVAQDTIGGVLSPKPGAERFRTSTIMHAEILRVPLKVWQAGHVAQLRPQQQDPSS